MNIEQFRTYCLAKPGVTEDFPFGETTLCMRVASKIFALCGLDNEILEINLKCDPEYAVELREQHPEVRPGYHMNKTHWNTVVFEGGTLDARLLRSLIDHSYDLVFKSLKKAEREAVLKG
jgi:predicted DNA-binding protein (MmcQ/YjbR family)